MKAIKSDLFKEIISSGEGNRLLNEIIENNNKKEFIFTYKDKEYLVKAPLLISWT